MINKEDLTDTEFEIWRALEEMDEEEAGATVQGQTQSIAEQAAKEAMELVDEVGSEGDDV